MSLIQKILDLLFGTPSPDSVCRKEEKSKRPYTDINNTKVGEVFIDYPMFVNHIAMKYSLQNVPDFEFRCTPKVSGNVTFRVYADGNKDDINNPELQTATFVENGDGKRMRFRMKMQAARQVGQHTISIDQICWTSRRADGSRVYTTYSTDTYQFEVVE